MKSIFLSANKTYLNGSVDLVKKGDIPHVLNIDFLTTQLWLRLNKGLGDNCKTTINVAINAQIALAALINTNLQREIENKGKDTNITQDEIAMEIAMFRSSVLKPEDITKEIIESNKEIISENIIEAKKIEIDNIKTENQILKNKSYKQELVILQYKKEEELRQKKHELRQAQILKYMNIFAHIITILIFLLVFIPLGSIVIYAIYYAITNISNFKLEEFMKYMVENMGNYIDNVKYIFTTLIFYKKIKVAIFNFLKKKFKLDKQVFK